MTNWSLAVETIRMTHKFYTLIFFFITSLLAFAIVYFSGILFEKFENRYGFLLYLHHEEAHFQSEHFFLIFLKYLRLQLPKQIIKHFSTYCLSASNFVILAPCSISNIPILSTVSWNRPHMGDLFLLCWL